MTFTVRGRRRDDAHDLRELLKLNFAPEVKRPIKIDALKRRSGKQSFEAHILLGFGWFTRLL